MLAALIYGKEDLRLEEVPFPTPDAREIAIKVRIATICSTHLNVWRRGGHRTMLKPTTLFGHEVVGKIISLSVTIWHIGA